jgi:hypothetical protein
VVLAEPDIAEGDCRIEWADGGINRERGLADAAIGEAVARYIGARRNLAGAHETSAIAGTHHPRDIAAAHELLRRTQNE